MLAVRGGICGAEIITPRPTRVELAAICRPVAAAGGVAHLQSAFLSAAGSIGTQPCQEREAELLARLPARAGGRW